jgi:hypothetical protein
LPTVVIAYVDNTYSSDVKVEFLYLNSQSKDVEICPMCEDDIIPSRETFTANFNRAIDKKMKEVEELQAKKEYFLRKYGAAIAAEWPTPEPATEVQPEEEDDGGWEPTGKSADHDDGWDA